MADQHFMGTAGFVWFIGIVENRVDPLKTGRCQVRIFGWHTDNKALQPTESLLWAHPVLPLNNDVVKPPKEGTMVMGFFMDGEGGQHPVMMGQIPGIPDTQPNPSKGFSDPRTDEQLANAPRPPQKVTYSKDGTGAQIQEYNAASKYPSVLNEPTNSRISRNENIQNTIVQSKIDNRLTSIPVSTGGLVINQGVDVEKLVSLRLQLPSITIPAISAGINLEKGFEICGIGINAGLSAGITLGGFTLGAPTIEIDGSFTLDGADVAALLAAQALLQDAAALAITIEGCLSGGKISDGLLLLDGLLGIPLLGDLSAGINLGPISLSGSVSTVSGGIPIGAMGGIPLSTPAVWSEPITAYNAVSPYNIVHETESGHVVELDDTPGAERIHTYHRSGTFDEMHPDGSRVAKTVKDNYQITLADNNKTVLGDNNSTTNGKDSEYVQGEKVKNIDGTETILLKSDQTETIMGGRKTSILKDDNLTVAQNRNTNIKGTETILIEKDCNIMIKAGYNVVVLGDCKLAVAGNLTAGVKGDAQLNIGGNFLGNITGDTNIVAGGDMNATVKGTTNINCDQTINMNGKIVNINADTIVNVNAPLIALNGKVIT
jgi:hypothetical protein